MPIKIKSFRSRFPLVLGMNTFDLGGTIIGVWLMNRFIFKKQSYIELFVKTFIIGELLHLLLRVDTPITRLITN